MRKHKLEAESLNVQSFEIADSSDARGTADQPDGCICLAAPCICTKGGDCTGG